MMSPDQGFQQDPATPNTGLLGGRLSRQALGRVVGAALILPGAAAVFGPATANADGSSLTPADYRVQVGPQLDENNEVPVTVFNTSPTSETFSFAVDGDANTQTGTVQPGTQDNLEFPAADEGAGGTFNIADTGDATTAITPLNFTMSFGESFPNQVGQGGDTTLATSEGGSSTSTSGTTTPGSSSSSTTTTETSTTTTTSTVETEGGHGHKRSHAKHHKKPENCDVPGVPKGGESWQAAVKQIVADHCALGGIKFGSEKGQTAVVTGFYASSPNPGNPKKIILRHASAGKVLAPQARLFPIVHYVAS